MLCIMLSGEKTAFDSGCSMVWSMHLDPILFLSALKAKSKAIVPQQIPYACDRFINSN